MKINGFNETLAIAEIREQRKATEKNAKKSYIANLIAQGIDKEVAKIMANVDFAYGIVKPL